MLVMTRDLSRSADKARDARNICPPPSPKDPSIAIRAFGMFAKTESSLRLTHADTEASASPTPSCAQPLKSNTHRILIILSKSLPSDAVTDRRTLHIALSQHRRQVALASNKNRLRLFISCTGCGTGLNRPFNFGTSNTLIMKQGRDTRGPAEIQCNYGIRLQKFLLTPCKG